MKRAGTRNMCFFLLGLIDENTSGLHVLVHCTMASEVVEIFPLFLYFFQLGRYYRKDIFPILLFGTCSCKRVKRKCRDSVTFQKLTAKK